MRVSYRGYKNRGAENYQLLSKTLNQVSRLTFDVVVELSAKCTDVDIVVRFFCNTRTTKVVKRP